MKYILSVIIPCFNEEKNIPELVERLANVFILKKINGEVILINDGSTDNTQESIEKSAYKNKFVKFKHLENNSGMETGWKTGLELSSGEYVCLIDADLQYLPEDVWRLYKAILYSHTDIVQGYRSSIGRLKDSRYILSKGLNFLLNFLFGMQLKDNKSGFILTRREVLEDILCHHFKYFYFQSFIMVAAKTKNYSIKEIETLFESRLLGKSFMPKFPVKVIGKVIIDIIKALFEYRIFDKREMQIEKYLIEKKNRHEKVLAGWRKFLFNIYFFTMPIHHWMISRNAAVYYQQLNSSQWLTAADVKKLQEEKLRKLINQVYYHVGYYREIFDKLNLKPSDINTVEDLRKLPLLNKNDVRENLYFDLMSDNHNKENILKISTSGSTGEPFMFFVDKVQLEYRWAATLRSMEWTGYRFGDKQMRLWHQTLGMSFFQILRERIDALFNRRIFISAYEMTDENIGKFIDKLKRYKPVLIDGYAESFNFIAYYIKKKQIKGVHPKAIISSAQILPEQSRKIIEKEFNCKVFDKYGSREFSGIAYECNEHKGHHVVCENYIVEIIKDGQPAKTGEMGEVIITDLNNYCMPFIRYRVGDIATALDNSELCKCGRGLFRIGKIEGRVQAIIIGTNGNYMPGTFFAHLFKDYDYIIRQYQVAQEQLGSIELKIIKAARFDEKIFEGVLKQLRSFLGTDIKINIHFVDKIAMVRTGKHQGSISKLDLDFQQLTCN